MKIVLASASPRRQELLKNIVKDFSVMPSGFEEKLPENISSEDSAEFLAVQKALDISKKEPEAVVIGSDTVVVAGGEILGKPKDRRDAVNMLKKLSGREHKVITGVAVFNGGKSMSFSQTTLVKFSPITGEEIEWYTDTGEPMDKAGAYGIQGFGSMFIEEIKGDYYSVMGLPVQRLYKVLKEICPENLRAGK